MKDINIFLKEVFPEIDFEKENRLIEDGLIDSFNLFRLLAGLQDEYKISIPLEEIFSENFNSITSISSLIRRLSK